MRDLQREHVARVIDQQFLQELHRAPEIAVAPCRQGGDMHAFARREAGTGRLGRLQTAAGARQQRGGSHQVEEIAAQDRSEEHTSELQSLMRISYAVICLKKKKMMMQNDGSSRQPTRVVRRG